VENRLVLKSGGTYRLEIEYSNMSEIPEPHRYSGPNYAGDQTDIVSSSRGWTNFQVDENDKLLNIRDSMSEDIIICCAVADALKVALRSQHSRAKPFFIPFMRLRGVNRRLTTSSVFRILHIDDCHCDSVAKTRVTAGNCTWVSVPSESGPGPALPVQLGPHK
jgi:hypothetical protein